MRHVWSRHWGVVLVAFLRAALLVIVFHTSGLAHLAVDVHEIVTTGHHSGTPFDEDDDDDGPAQAPGSSTCHHAQPGTATLSSVALARLDIVQSARLEVIEPAERAPRAPPNPGVYRPPRA